MINRNLNDHLNEFKKIFDRIESYNTNQNIGLRSLKNIGVWLCIYALTSDDDRIAVLNELASKAGISSDEISKMSRLAEHLIQPEILADIIQDYEKANGHFTLTVNSKLNLNLLNDKIKEKKYENVLSSHVKIDLEQDADIVFLMDNAIKFNWAKDHYRKKPAQFKKTTNKFYGEKMDYLEANSEDHMVEYGIIDHHKRLYHVARFGTLQKDEANFKPTYTYLIESVDPNDTIYLQKDYFEIINQIKLNNLNDEKTYHILKNNKLATSNATIHGKLSDNEWNEFQFTVRFPKMTDTLITTEERLGIYEHFLGKRIANLPIERIKYKGTRKLNYDESGGEIENREEVLCFQESCRKTPNIINIQYTATKAFMMVYEAENGVDYYPFFIANPRKDLKMSFCAEESYPEQKIVESHQEQKPAGFGTSTYSVFNSVLNSVCTSRFNPSPKNAEIIEEKPLSQFKNK